MTVLSLVEFDDETEHTFDNTKLELANDKGQMKNVTPVSELFFFNFDEDDGLNSKRGNEEIELTGTADITNGFLNLDKDDNARAKILNVQNASLATAFSFRFKLKTNFSNDSGTSNFLTLKSNVDLSQIRWYFTGPIGIDTRVNLEVTNSLGNIVHSGIQKTIEFAVGDVIQFGFAKDALSSFATIDGAGSSVPPAFTADMSDCDILFGDNANTRWSYDDFQFFNDKQDFVTGEIIPEPVSLDLNENTMLTEIPFLLDEMTEFDVTEQIPANSSLKHYFLINLTPVWFNTVSGIWEVTDGTLAQANTKQEINDNLALLPIVKGIGAFFQVAHIFKSTDGYTTALLENITLKFSFQFKTSDITTCLIFGTVTDQTGDPVVGATIEFQSDDKFTGGVFVGPKSVVTSNAQGKYSISIIETETTNTAVNILIKYDSGEKEDNGDVIFEEFPFKNRIIPNVPTKELSLLAELAS